MATKKRGTGWSSGTPGVRLVASLHPHSRDVSGLAWAPDGSRLATAAFDGSVKFFRMDGAFIGSSPPREHPRLGPIAWSPDGKTIASAQENDKITLWSTSDIGKFREIQVPVTATYAVAWSPTGRRLAIGGSDGVLYLVDSETGAELTAIPAHEYPLQAVYWRRDEDAYFAIDASGALSAWKADEISWRVLPQVPPAWQHEASLAVSNSLKVLALSNADGAVHIIEEKTGRELHTIEGFPVGPVSLSFSSDGKLLAIAPSSRSCFVYSTIDWSVLVRLPYSKGPFRSAAMFHPREPLLALRGPNKRSVQLFRLDARQLVRGAPTEETVHYTNAKVVLVGDSGVGKSGLGLVLSGQPFTATESTHGRRIWTFSKEHVALSDLRQETREILLWDLAGQPGYRIVHQLHLSRTAMALLVMDSRSETEPFAGVMHWDRALRQAWSVSKDHETPKKLLVAARCDRGGIGVSRARIDRVVEEMGFAGFFETSARDAIGIEELRRAIATGIHWDKLPRVTSTALFEKCKGFLLGEKKRGRSLASLSDLFAGFLLANETLSGDETLRAQFFAAIGRIEASGLVRQLSFGDLVLLQPELLDAYASAIVHAAKEEPDGLGSIAEEDVKAVRFGISRDERIADPQEEQLLLIATVEDLLRHEIALREHAEEGPYLIFPSQFTREWPDAPDPEGKAVVVGFEGAVDHIYATLAVRLAHSGQYARREMWKNAAVFTASVGGICGVWLRRVEEGRAELALFFTSDASEETRFRFEQYVLTHVERRAIPGSVYRRRIYVCEECGTPVTEMQVKRRRERGEDWIRCGVCDQSISLLDREARLSRTAVANEVRRIDVQADAKRRMEAAASTLEGKRATNDFDVFLCHNSADKELVRNVGEELRKQGLNPWLDEWELRPGMPWQEELERQIASIRSAAVFVGPAGVGPWQQQELSAFLREFVNRQLPVIPVLLPGAPGKLTLPLFLRGLTWVDLRGEAPGGIGMLLWGITGRKPPQITLFESSLPDAT